MQAVSYQAGEHGSWFTLAELAELNLPGLSSVRRVIAKRAESWGYARGADGEPLARKRAGRGGGLEYHAQLLPAEARLELVRRGLIAEEPAPVTALALVPVAEAPSAWAQFDAKPDKIKAEARERLEAVQAVETLKATTTATQAVMMVASQRQISQASLWSWLKMVKGARPSDWLPALAPAWKGGGALAEIDPAIWQAFKSDFLRPKVAYAEAYGRVKHDLADPLGIVIPCCATFKRRLEAEVPRSVVIAMKDGIQAAMDNDVPHQRRTVRGLSALEAVNVDGHKFDVRVRFPAAHGEAEVVQRPIMVMIQDIYSRKIVAWRIGRVESATLTRLAFADLFDRWGIPSRVLMDNGRAFASKVISGGAKTRYRFKIQDNDPLGLLTSLGIENIHWATPGRGQVKPIERSFKTLNGLIARHPVCDGAYTGPNPMEKPYNLGDKAVDLDVFTRLVEAGIAAYNARTGRRTETAQGGSFDAAFNASYERHPVPKADAAVRRLALLAPEQLRVSRKGGVIEYLGNRYASPQLLDLAGDLVTIRVDPDNLHQPIHVYDSDGRYVCQAEIIEDAGFFSVDAAKAQAKLRAEHNRALRRQIEIADLLSAQDLARLYASMAPDEEPDTPVAKVVKPVRHRGQTAAALKLQPVVSGDADHAFMDKFGAAVAALKAPSEVSEKPVLTLLPGGKS